MLHDIETTVGTKEALNLISNQFNTGTSKINYLKTFETSKQQIFKSNH